MNENDLRRVKNDLETLESAIGFRVWDPRELRINLLFAASGLAASVWTIAPHGLMPILGFGFFLLPVAEWLRAASAIKTEGPSLRRDFKGALRTVWLLAPLVALFFWCRYVGLLPVQFLGLAEFLLGALLFSAAIGERTERALLSWGVALMSGGLLLPLAIAPPVAVLAATLGVGGLVSAGFAYATRQDANQHATG